MKILQALRHLDNAIDFKNLGYNEAWQTLKTAVLAQQTTNKQSMPCLMHAGVNESCDVFGDGRCGSVACQLARA